MKLWLCTWGTNYGLQCCVVSALTMKSAFVFALDYGAWPDSLEINEIIPRTEEGVIRIDFYNNYGG